MGKFYGLLALVTLFNSGLISAEELKKMYDKEKDRVVEVCSTDADGSMNVAIRCHYNWIDIPIISYAADPKIKRKPSELVDIITPVHKMRNKDSIYGVFQNSLVEFEFGMANNTSQVIIYQPSDDSKHKYAINTSWIINNEDFSKEVDSVPGYKKEDIFCIKKSPDGYRDNLPVKIKRLFDKEKYAVVDTVDQRLINTGSFVSHFTSLDNLGPCQFDPAKVIQTQAPALPQDLKVNDQTAGKDITSVDIAPAKDHGSSVISK